MPGVCSDGDGILHSPTLPWLAAVLLLQSAHRALPSLLLPQRCLQPQATAQAAAVGHSAAQNMALRSGCQLSGNLVLLALRWPASNCRVWHPVAVQCSTSV